MVREKADTFSARTLSVLGHVKGFRPHPMAWAVMEGFKQRRTASNLTFFFFFFYKFSSIKMCTMDCRESRTRVGRGDGT